MSYKFSFVFVCCALLSVSCTKPQANLEEDSPHSSPKRSEVGNGGDYIQLLLEEGRSNAILMLNRINLNAFSDDLKAQLFEGELDWILNNKQSWAEDLKESSFKMVEELPEGCTQDDDACAPSLKLIYFSRPQVERKIKSPKEAARLLLHETGHHFFGTDEIKVRRVTSVVFTAYYRGHTDTAHWETISKVGAPPSVNYKMLATDSHLLFWGTDYHSSIYLYEPWANTWEKRWIDKREYVTSLSQNPGSEAVWVSNQVMIYYQCRLNGYPSENKNAGLTYDPKTNLWGTIEKTGSPSPRAESYLIRAGNKLIVWGGYDCSTGIELNDGGIYDPATESWEPISSEGAPRGARERAVVWSGKKLVVWGVLNWPENIINASYTAGFGASYDPSSKRWTQMPKEGEPDETHSCIAVSTGDKVLIYGSRFSYPETGDSLERTLIKTGAIYDPSSNKWESLNLNEAPSPNKKKDYFGATGFSATLFGGNVIVNGKDLRLFDPIKNSWSTPSSRFHNINPTYFQKIFVTGAELILWDNDEGHVLFP